MSGIDKTEIDEIDVKGACVDVMTIMMHRGFDLEDVNLFTSIAKRYSEHGYLDNEGDSINREGVELRTISEYYSNTNDEEFNELKIAAERADKDVADNFLPSIEMM